MPIGPPYTGSQPQPERGFIYVDYELTARLQRIEDKLNSIMHELGFRQPSVRWDLPYNRDDAILDEQQ